jgi:lipid II isoglutaminyl synthase (glutamine-hydrolysing)
LASVLSDFDDPLVVLLNLSRDQLDRFGEVRTVAAAWRRALGDRAARVVANADDPLVVWGAGTATSVTWVAVGLRWRLDAASCPNCGAVIAADDDSWACTSCELRQPTDVYRLDGATLLDPSGASVATLQPGVPGRHNLGNAAQALVAALQLGASTDAAAAAMQSVTSVSGRYRTISAGRARARLLLAKNPAGWAELLGMIDGDSRPLVLAINARIADGRDPSWLYDVPFERLQGRSVVAAGERAADLAVRLHYADVPCEIWDGDILDRLPQFGDTDVDVVANYTVFADLVRKVT